MHHVFCISLIPLAAAAPMRWRREIPEQPIAFVQNVSITQKSEANVAYTLTPADLASVTDPEAAFSTTRLLPDWADIPEDFRSGNLYTKLAETIFFGWELPNCQIQMKEGFDPQALNRAVRAHLHSFGPKHQHKIAGVGLMIAQAAVLLPPENARGSTGS